MIKITIITGRRNKNKLNNNTKNKIIRARTTKRMIQALMPVVTNMTEEMF